VIVSELIEELHNAERGDEAELVVDLMLPAHTIATMSFLMFTRSIDFDGIDWSQPVSTNGHTAIVFQ
jgi:hypothetical protein